MISRVNITCVSREGQNGALPVENRMAVMHDSVCEEDYLSQEHRLVENCIQEENARTYINGFAEVIWEL